MTKNPSRTLRLPAAAGIALILTASLPGTATAQNNLARGQELFEQHCQACHYDFHQPQTRHLKTLDELKQRITSWAVHTNTGWTRQEVDDVLHYLNTSFYKFPKQSL